MFLVFCGQLVRILRKVYICITIMKSGVFVAQQLNDGFQWSVVSNQKHNSPVIGWLEFNVPFQHKYGYIRDDNSPV